MSFIQHLHVRKHEYCQTWFELKRLFSSIVARQRLCFLVEKVERRAFQMLMTCFETLHFHLIVNAVSYLINFPCPKRVR